MFCLKEKCSGAFFKIFFLFKLKENYVGLCRLKKFYSLRITGKTGKNSYKVMRILHFTVVLKSSLDLQILHLWTILFRVMCIEQFT